MTRETKVGLLVGLGFIVVFAVLLSYDGSNLSLTQILPPTTTDPTRLEESEGGPVGPGPLPGTSVDLGPANDLPREFPPLQPPIPQPATRPAAPARTTLPEPYVVRRGENLGQIAKMVYGKSSPDVISYLVDINDGTIKDRDSLREGQTILTPPLPADLSKGKTVLPKDGECDGAAADVPPFARIAGVAVGRSTMEEMEHRLGPGLPQTGGHFGGARVWRSRQTGWYIRADWLEHYSRGQGIDDITISASNDTGRTKVSWVSLPRKQLRFMGAVELGMKRSQALEALKSKLPPPQASGQDLVWTAQGNALVNQGGADHKEDWEARLRFRHDRLVEIRISSACD